MFENGESDFFDPNLIPVIPKLLATDTRTLLNCKEQINLSKNLPRRNEVLNRENKALFDTYMHEDFPPKMLKYMLSVNKNFAAKL